MNEERCHLSRRPSHVRRDLIKMAKWRRFSHMSMQTSYMEH